MKPIETLLDAGQLTEDQAREYLEQIRWPSGPGCPRCGDTSVYLMQGKSTRPGLYKCRGCRKPFSVTVGTIFERSHIPLRKWILAFHLVCSSKKGVSALQLKRNLGLGSYKTAWFMAHRIRHAMRSEPLASMLQGIVEIDETYVGGKPRKRGQSKRGRGTKKTPVIVLVERDGEARAMVRHRLTAEKGSHLKRAIRENVDRSSRIMTDSAADFAGLDSEFASHETTNHLRGEYARGDIHSNTAESFFALVKRSVHGIHHSVSRRHLDRYLAERAFVWTHRKVSDGERARRALQAAEGKRLVYQAVTS